MCDPAMMVRIALKTLERLPINALRHPVHGNTTGWYIWGGEYSCGDDFFQPIHAAHLFNVLPSLIPYLALAPGWRVLLAPEQIDIWYDPASLNV